MSDWDGPRAYRPQGELLFHRVLPRTGMSVAAHVGNTACGIPVYTAGRQTALKNVPHDDRCPQCWRDEP